MADSIILNFRLIFTRYFYPFIRDNHRSDPVGMGHAARFYYEYFLFPLFIFFIIPDQYPGIDQ